MTNAAVKDTLLLGALTGMRSMAGPTALALRRGGTIAKIASALAAGEMMADKTEAVGNRTDVIPLAGRALMGAIVGGVIAHEHRSSRLAGGLLGAAAAVVMAHVAFQLRTRMPGNNVVGGMLEDALIVGTGVMHERQRA